MNLENITVRIPKDLRAIIEASAKQAGSTNADEIRKALTSYYGLDTSPVTLADLEARISAHEAQMHTASSNVIENTTAEPEPSKATSKAQALTDKTRKDEHRKIQCLLQLSKMLDAGSQPTPSEIGEALEVSPLFVGRALASLGITAKNTRINGISARYYLSTLKPQVDELKLKLNGRS